MKILKFWEFLKSEIRRVLGGDSVGASVAAPLAFGAGAWAMLLFIWVCWR